MAKHRTASLEPLPPLPALSSASAAGGNVGGTAHIISCLTPEVLRFSRLKNSVDQIDDIKSKKYKVDNFLQGTLPGCIQCNYHIQEELY